MALRDEWKETGKSLGKAFGGLGKNIGRSAETVAGKATGDGKEENVFNDGSWRQTGKDLGKAFMNVGVSILDSVDQGVSKVSDSTKATEAAEGSAEKVSGEVVDKDEQ